MVINHTHCILDHHQRYLQEKDPLVQLDPQHPSRRRADFSVPHHEREAMNKEHQATSRRTLTTQPEESQEVSASMGTTMPSTTLPMRITPSSRLNMTTMSATPPPLLQVEHHLQKLSELMVVDRCMTPLPWKSRTWTLWLLKETFIMKYILICNYLYLTGSKSVTFF